MYRKKIARGGCLLEERGHLNVPLQKKSQFLILLMQRCMDLLAFNPVCVCVRDGGTGVMHEGVHAAWKEVGALGNKVPIVHRSTSDCRSSFPCAVVARSSGGVDRVLINQSIRQSL